MRTTPTRDKAYRMYNIHVDSYEQMCFSMKQYPVVCDNVAYDVNSEEEVARVEYFLDSSDRGGAASKRSLRRQATRHGLQTQSSINIPVLFDIPYKQ